MSDLVLSRVSKTYPAGVRAVAELSMHVGPGEIVVIAGPSGCGKTTVLRLVAGLERPTHGTIEIAGRDVTSLPPGRRSIAMVLQDHPLYPHLNVWENVLFGLNGEDRMQAERKAADVAQSLGIAELMDRGPTELSGGESQRVALARAMVRSRRVTLFDEPLSSVDQPQRLAIRPHLRQFASETGSAVVYVTHDQSEALALADRLLVMRLGHIEQFGTPDEVYQRPATRFVAEFFAGDPICFLKGQIVVSEQGVQFESNGWSVPVPASMRSAGIRPRVDLGIRASAVSPSVESASGAMPIRARVADVALLADGALATFEVEGLSNEHSTRLFGRFPADKRPAVGTVLDLQLNLSALRWFDAETGRSLAAGTSESLSAD